MMRRPKTLPFKKKTSKPVIADDQTCLDAYDVWVKNERNQSETAKELGVPRTTLQQWLTRAKKLKAAAEGQPTADTPEALNRAEALKTAAAHADVSLIEAFEIVAKDLLFAMPGLKNNPRKLTAIGQRVHVLAQDIQMLDGRPGTIKRTETVTATLPDYSTLSVEELLAFAKLVEKTTPGSNVKFIDSAEPVILEGIEDSDAEAAEPAPGPT